MKKTAHKKIKVPTDKSELKWFTPNQVFKKASKTKVFQDSYRAEMTRIRLAKDIRDTRLEKRLTQGEVAKKASMPQSVIARIESGEHGVSVETLSRVANVLGKEVELI